MSELDYFSWTVIQWELYPIPSALGSQISSGLVSSTVGDHVRSPGTVRFVSFFSPPTSFFLSISFSHSFSSHSSILFILLISFFYLFLLFSLVRSAGIEPTPLCSQTAVGVWAVSVSDDSRESSLEWERKWNPSRYEPLTTITTHHTNRQHSSS